MGELATIDAVLQAWAGWRPHELKFSIVTCAIDGSIYPNETGINLLDHVSFILMLDEESNRVMMDWVAELESAIREVGLEVHTSRRQQEPYHTTLAVVNGTAYPVGQAITALNEQFPPDHWVDKPVVLEYPCVGHGNNGSMLC